MPVAETDWEHVMEEEALNQKLTITISFHPFSETFFYVSIFSEVGQRDAK